MRTGDLLGAFDVRTFPRSRIPTLDTLAWGRKRYHIPVLLEADVTTAREVIRAQRARSGETVSFTGWIVKCLGRAVSEHPGVHAIRRGRRQLIDFRDVDVAVIIERDVGTSETLPMPYVIRRANEKSLAAIHTEIRTAQRASVTDGEVQVGSPRPSWATRLFTTLPRTARNWVVWRRLLRNPFYAKRTIGTVGVTAVGMMGQGGISWGIPIGIHPLVVAVGGIAPRLVLAGDRPVTREYLGLTVLFDHEVTDGAPAARFIARLQELMASGYGLQGDASNADGPAEANREVTARLSAESPPRSDSPLGQAAEKLPQKSPNPPDYAAPQDS
jgi:hypothetical protein